MVRSPRKRASRTIRPVAHPSRRAQERAPQDEVELADPHGEEPAQAGVSNHEARGPSFETRAPDSASALPGPRAPPATTAKPLRGDEVEIVAASVGWVEPLAKPITVVANMMGIASAFALRATADTSLNPSYRLLRPSLRANGSRECAPDDRLREAIHRAAQRKNGLLRRCTPRNDVEAAYASPQAGRGRRGIRHYGQYFAMAGPPKV
jgi:hypothetical protein